MDLTLEASSPAAARKTDIGVKPRARTPEKRLESRKSPPLRRLLHGRRSIASARPSDDRAEDPRRRREERPLKE